MKKTKILSLTLALILIFSLTAQSMVSCDKKSKEEEAFEDKLGISELDDKGKFEKLYELSDVYYENSANQKTTGEMSMKGSSLGIDFDITTKMNETEIAILEGDRVGHKLITEEKTVSKSATGKTEEEVSTKMSGYADGYMYYASIPDNDEAKATYKKSPCDFEDYRALQKAKYADNTDMDFDDMAKLAKNVTVKQDGSNWVCSFSGAADYESVKESEYVKGFSSSLPCGVTLTDISAKFTFNGSSGACKKAVIKLELESVENASYDFEISIDMTVTFALPSGSENFTPEYFDLYDTDIDLFAKEKAMVANDALLESEGISFSMGTASKVDYLNERNAWVTASSYSEETAIEYGVKDGNFVFCYAVNREGYDGSTTQGKVLYDGTTVKAEVRGEGVHKQAMSQYDARATIFDSTLVHLSFNEEDVINASVVESGSGYGLMLQLGMNETIRALIESSSLDPDALTEFEQLVTFNFNGNDDLVSIDYVITYSQTINGVLYRVTTESSIYDITDSDLSFISK